MTSTGDEDLERFQARVGQTLRGKWKLDGLLGVGGMAAVYSATHRIGRRGAIKILHPEVAISKELKARFEQEAHAVSKLGHPGAVEVLDVDATDEGVPFMVMELLDGESLGQRAYRLGGIPERELLGYVAELCDVLEAAHAMGIIHRDIKPDNLFITGAGQLKVLDFGIARMRGAAGSVKTRTGAMLGTTSYMAPEQIHGREIDGRVDIYSVGATMFRLLAKRKIHEADSDAELLVKMGTVPAPLLLSVAPEVDPRIAKIVDRALAFAAGDRYPDAKTMRDDVRAVLAGEEPPYASLVGARMDAPTRSDVGGAPMQAQTAPSPTWAAPAVSAASTTVDPMALNAVAIEPTRSSGKRMPLAALLAIGGVALTIGIGLTSYFMLLDSSTEPVRRHTSQTEGEEADVTPSPKESASAEASDSSDAPAPSDDVPIPAEGTHRPVLRPSATSKSTSTKATPTTTSATPTTTPATPTATPPKPTATPTTKAPDPRDKDKDKEQEKAKRPKKR